MTEETKPRVLVISYRKEPFKPHTAADYELWDSYNEVVISPLARCRYCGHNGHTRRPEPTTEYRGGLPADWNEDGTAKNRWIGGKTTIVGRESTCNFCGHTWEPCVDPATLGDVAVTFLLDGTNADNPQYIDLRTAGGEVLRIRAGQNNGCSLLYLEHAGRWIRLPFHAEDVAEMTDGGKACLRCGTLKDEAGRCYCEICQSMADQREGRSNE